MVDARERAPTERGFGHDAHDADGRMQMAEDALHGVLR
jgi:hypothetical protein